MKTHINTNRATSNIVFPQNMKALVFEHYSDSSEVIVFPNDLEELHTNCRLECFVFPQPLVRLTLDESFNQDVEVKKSFLRNVISLKILVLTN